LSPSFTKKDDPRPRRCVSEYHPTDMMEPSLIVQSRFISTSGLFRQLAKIHYNEPGQSDPNLGKTQNTMDQIHRSPTRWETKIKGREGAPRMPSLAMASSPKLQRIEEATTPGREQRTRSREPTRVLSRAFAASFPPGPASPEELQRWAIREATTWGDTEADARSGAPRAPPSACSTKPPVGPVPRNTEGATGEIWSLTTPLGKGTGGPARTISPHGVPIPQRRHTTSGRSTIAGACLRRIPRRSQAFF